MVLSVHDLSPASAPNLFPVEDAGAAGGYYQQQHILNSLDHRQLSSSNQRFGAYTTIFYPQSKCVLIVLPFHRTRRNLSNGSDSAVLCYNTAYRTSFSELHLKLLLPIRFIIASEDEFNAMTRRTSINMLGVSYMEVSNKNLAYARQFA